MRSTNETNENKKEVVEKQVDKNLGPYGVLYKKVSSEMKENGPLYNWVNDPEYKKDLEKFRPVTTPSFFDADKRTLLNLNQEFIIKFNPQLDAAHQGVFTENLRVCFAVVCKTEKEIIVTHANISTPPTLLAKKLIEQIKPATTCTFEAAYRSNAEDFAPHFKGSKKIYLETHQKYMAQVQAALEQSGITITKSKIDHQSNSGMLIVDDSGKISEPKVRPRQDLIATPSNLEYRKHVSVLNNLFEHVLTLEYDKGWKPLELNPKVKPLITEILKKNPRLDRNGIWDIITTNKEMSGILEKLKSVPESYWDMLTDAIVAVCSEEQKAARSSLQGPTKR